MKDIHGNDLPEPQREFIGSDDSAYGMTCHGCKRKITKGKKWTIRHYGYDGNKHPVQGPLCPHCSELPPEHLPSRRFTERWW